MQRTATVASQDIGDACTGHTSLRTVATRVKRAADGWLTMGSLSHGYIQIFQNADDVVIINEMVHDI